MTVTTEKKAKTEATPNQEDLGYKIEVATQTLDRNISFVTNCDNKTSIVLAAFGVLLAIILTNEGLNEIFNIVKTCIETKNFCSILYLLFLPVQSLLWCWECSISEVCWSQKLRKKQLEEKMKTLASFLRE